MRPHWRRSRARSCHDPFCPVLHGGRVGVRGSAAGRGLLRRAGGKLGVERVRRVAGGPATAVWRRTRRADGHVARQPVVRGVAPLAWAGDEHRSGGGARGPVLRHAQPAGRDGALVRGAQDGARCGGAGGVRANRAGRGRTTPARPIVWRMRSPTHRGRCKARVASYGADSADVRAWVTAQDAVFTACAKPVEALPPLADGAPVWLRADHAYQSAALMFYNAHYVEAAEAFMAIAGDLVSPWHDIAPYLRTRALLRRALDSRSSIRLRGGPQCRAGGVRRNDAGLRRRGWRTWRSCGQTRPQRPPAWLPRSPRRCWRPRLRPTSRICKRWWTRRRNCWTGSPRSRRGRPPRRRSRRPPPPGWRARRPRRAGGRRHWPMRGTGMPPRMTRRGCWPPWC